MKITWKDVYYPIGKWNDEMGEEVEINHSFRAKFNDQKIIVLLINKVGGGGHGDPRFTAIVPLYICEDTLDNIDIKNGTFIEINA